MKDLAGKTAFITGGASGLGLGMAKAFAEAGMKLILADNMPEHLDSAREEMRDVEHCRFIRLDVTDREGFVRAADEAEHELGPVSVLCNNAGVGFLASTDQTEFADWDWVMSVNLGGTINGIRTFLPRMQANGGGHIVNTSSIGAALPGPGGAAYLTSKAAVLGLSESLACEMRGTGIGVTTILLGPTVSNIHKVSRQRAIAFENDAPDAETAAILDKPILAGGMDPVEGGRKVLEAIKRDQLYLFTHPEFRHAVQQRFDAIMTGFGKDPGGPPATESYGFPTFNPIFAEIIEASRGHS